MIMPFLQSCSNAWAVAGMTRVLATILKWDPPSNVHGGNEYKSFVQEAVSTLIKIIENMLGCMVAQPRDKASGLLKNYLDGEEQASAEYAFGDAAGTSLVTAAIYRLMVLFPNKFLNHQWLSWAEANLNAVGKHVHRNGRVGPVASIEGVPSKHPEDETSEGQSMALLLYAARMDFLKTRRWSERAKFWVEWKWQSISTR